MVRALALAGNETSHVQEDFAAIEIVKWWEPPHQSESAKMSPHPRIYLLVVLGTHTQNLSSKGHHSLGIGVVTILHFLD